MIKIYIFTILAGLFLAGAATAGAFWPGYDMTGNPTTIIFKRVVEEPTIIFKRVVNECPAHTRCTEQS